MINNTDQNNPDYDFYFNQAALVLIKQPCYVFFLISSHSVPVVDPLVKQLKLQDKTSYLNCCKQFLLLLSTRYVVIRREYLSSFAMGQLISRKLS